MIAPVETLPSVIVPDPLAFSVRFSFVPLDSTETARPPAAAADFTLRPVALLAVEASTLNAGLVAPASPTASAFADADVMVCAPLANVVKKPASGVVVPIITLLIWLPPPEMVPPSVKAGIVPADDGLPSAPPLTTNAPAVPMFTANAVVTPVPSPVMEPTAGVTVTFEAAVMRPLALTVNCPT